MTKTSTSAPFLVHSLEEASSIFTWWLQPSHHHLQNLVTFTTKSPSACPRAQSCPTLCDPVDGRRPGSSVHGILQARTLEWVAISSSMGSSRPRDPTHTFCTGRRVHYHRATWEGNSVCVKYQLPIPSSPHPQPLGTRTVLSMSMKLPIPGTS